jgi:glycosyltransferase involved in cell wall biosynthesis
MSDANAASGARLEVKGRAVSAASAAPGGQAALGRVNTGPNATGLRVALVTGSYNYIADGVALTLNRMVGFLESRGVEVLVFAPVGRAPAFAHQGEVVPVPSIAAPGRGEYRVALGLPPAPRRRLLAFRPDILHVATPDLLGHSALRLGRRMGWPVVASYHTRYETYLKYYGLDVLRGRLKSIIREFYNACREVYVPSASMIEALRADGVGGDVRLWPRGVDTARFDPRRRSPAWRAALGLAPEEVAVAFVGRFVREKRVAEAAGVFRRLRAAGVAHRALFVGDGPERAWLEREVPGALFPGFLGGEDLATAYASADVFLFPSDTETFGNVTLEAMASGLPTVCANATGSRSLVDPGVTGYLAEVGDEEALFAAVRALLTDPVMRRRMGHAARLRAQAFSWDEAMGGLLDRYLALAGPLASR